MNINVKDNMQFTMLRMGGVNMLESTKKKLESRQQTQSQIDFFEKQKDNLKNMECGSIEEIAKKLEMFHTYEEEIAAAKHEYNQGQMFRVLEEAKEQGEKIAEAAEKTESKTEEERKEEMRDEALGIDEEKGVLSEMLEEMTAVVEEGMEAMEENVGALEENTETMEENIEALEENTKTMEENTKTMEENVGALEENTATMAEQETEQKRVHYVPIDVRL